MNLTFTLAALVLALAFRLERHRQQTAVMKQRVISTSEWRKRMLRAGLGKK